MGGSEMFRLEHFGAIADWAGAPPGWPFIPWELAEAMNLREELVVLRKSLRKRR
jgi:hypothetical protein